MFDSLETKGFIKEYSDLILESIPTSKDWSEAIAMTVESVVLGNVKVTTKIGPLALNIWNLMVGPSGLAYKTTPLIYYVYPTLAEVTEMISKPVIMPSRFSVEGMIEYVSGGYKTEKGSKKKIWVPGNNEGCIIKDEFTTLFKEAQSKQYLADVMEFMSELFDGAMQKRFTRKTKLEQSKRVYVSLLAATTPYLFSVMDKNFFIQGTGNRILYTIFEPSKPEEFNAEEYFVTGKREREREGKISEFAGKLGKIHDSNLRYIFPMDEAGEMWVKFKAEKDRIAFKRYKANPQDVVYTYLQRLPIACLKMAALAAVSKGYETIPSMRGDTLMIGEDEMTWAINKTEKHLKYFNLLLEKWEITPKEVQPEVHERELIRMLVFVKDSGDKMLTQSELLSRSSMVKSKKFYDLIGTLISRGELEVVPDEEVKAFSRDVMVRHDLVIFKGGEWVKSYRGQIPNVYRIVAK